jgi:hypothetical protein
LKKCLGDWGMYRLICVANRRNRGRVFRVQACHPVTRETL